MRFSGFLQGQLLPGDVGRLMNDAGALVLDKHGQSKLLPVPGRLDLEREPLRDRRLAVELDGFILRLSGREARDERLAGIFPRWDVGDNAVLAEHGADQKRRLLGPSRAGSSP